METTKYEPRYYDNTLRTLGQFIEREKLSEVSILEYAQGWIIHGVALRPTNHGLVRVVKDFVLSHEDVQAMGNAHETQRRDRPKRRWGL